MALHYAHRFGSVKSLLLLAPVLAYSSLLFKEEVRAQWEREGTTAVFHYAFNEKIPLRYDFYLDGLRYTEQISPPAPVSILHGKNDGLISVENSKGYASTYPGMVMLRELESDHMLHDKFDAIWENVTSLL